MDDLDDSSSVALQLCKWVLASSRIFSLEDSLQIYFYRVRLSASPPTPNLDDQVSVFITPETGLPSYTPGQWVAWVPRDRHFPYTLTTAPEGDLDDYVCEERDVLYNLISF
jgi:hypothetical protein